MKKLFLIILLAPLILFGQTTLTSANKLLKEKKFKKAKQEYSDLIKSDSTLSEAYLGRGECFYELKEYKLAIDDYTMSIQLKPDFVKAYSSRAGAYYLVQQYQNAIQDYTKMIELNTNDLSSIYFLRGLCKTLLPKEDVDGACNDFKKAKSLGFDLSSMPGLNKYCNSSELE